MTSSILGLANGIQAIIGDALAEATSMFHLKTHASPGKGTLPRHLWPKTVRQDVSTIRRRAKVIRCLNKHETKQPADAQDEPPPPDPSLPLWSIVATPLILRTFLSPLPKNMDALGVLVRPDPLVGTSTLSEVQECFTHLKKATRHLFRYARNVRRLKYGKALLRMFEKKPSVAMKSILRTSEETTDNVTILTDFSILQDDKSRTSLPRQRRC